MHDDAIKAQHDQWSSFHSFAQTFEKAKTSLRIAVSELGSLASFFPIFYFVFAIDSCVQELRQEFAAVQTAQNKARQREEELRKRRSSHEAWFAQNEIVKFRLSRRYEVSPVNLAKATAGMPAYG